MISVMSLTCIGPDKKQPLRDISLDPHPSCSIIKTNQNSQLLRFNYRLLTGQHSSSAPVAQRQTTTWQRDVPRCILRRAWRQLEAFLHLASVISVSGDSHLVQGGDHEGATQTVSENGLCCVTSKASQKGSLMQHLVN